MKPLNKNILINESAVSDEYERDVANTINSYFSQFELSLTAERPVASTGYSDIAISQNSEKNKIEILTHKKQNLAWIEVKMNHTDNLYNKRFQYKNGFWQPMTPHLVGNIIADALNQNSEANDFILKLADFVSLNPEDLYIPSSARNVPKNAVSRDDMEKFVKEIYKTGNIATLPELNVFDLVVMHYAKGGKKENVSYLQSGDDFYRFTESNPVGFSSHSVPVLSEKMVVSLIPVFRISIRSRGYELMTTLKFKKISSSPTSFAPNSTKPRPLIDFKNWLNYEHR